MSFNHDHKDTKDALPKVLKSKACFIRFSLEQQPRSRQTYLLLLLLSQDNARALIEIFVIMPTTDSNIVLLLYNACTCTNGQCRTNLTFFKVKIPQTIEKAYTRNKQKHFHKRIATKAKNIKYLHINPLIIDCHHPLFMKAERYLVTKQQAANLCVFILYCGGGVYFLTALT